MKTLWRIVKYVILGFLILIWADIVFRSPVEGEKYFTIQKAVADGTAVSGSAHIPVTSAGNRLNVFSLRNSFTLWKNLADTQVTASNFAGVIWTLAWPFVIVTFVIWLSVRRRRQVGRMRHELSSLERDIKIRVK